MLLAVDTATGTLAAAVIAAVAAIGSLVVTTISGYRREGREAQRAALQPHLAPLADAIHQTVATSSMQHKALVDGKRELAAKWRKRGTDASSDLERIRLEVRYPLPGVDEGLRSLTRIPNWVAHRKGGDEGGALLQQADSLAKALHRAIESSWRRGRPPGTFTRHRLTRRVGAVRAVAPIGPRDASDADE